jgi:hypothetical protein
MAQITAARLSHRGPGPRKLRSRPSPARVGTSQIAHFLCLVRGVPRPILVAPRIRTAGAQANSRRACIRTGPHPKQRFSSRASGRWVPRPRVFATRSALHPPRPPPCRHQSRRPPCPCKGLTQRTRVWSPSCPDLLPTSFARPHHHPGSAWQHHRRGPAPRDRDHGGTSSNTTRGNSTEPALGSYEPTRLATYRPPRDSTSPTVSRS